VGIWWPLAAIILKFVWHHHRFRWARIQLPASASKASTGLRRWFLIEPDTRDGWCQVDPPTSVFFRMPRVEWRSLDIFPRRNDFAVALEIGSRRLVYFNVTEHPTAAWTRQQLREALPGDEDYKFVLLIGTRLSASLDEEVESWGIRVSRSPVRMPTANAHCERLNGTIRRECLDYVIPLNASHLRRTLRAWMCHTQGLLT
jgi:Integrase core domain